MPRPILVVDDNALNRELLLEELSHRAFDVTTASGGREALALLEQVYHKYLTDTLLHQHYHI